MVSARRAPLSITFLQLSYDANLYRLRPGPRLIRRNLHRVWYPQPRQCSVNRPVLGQGQRPPRAARIVRGLPFQPGLGYSLQATITAQAAGVLAGKDSVLVLVRYVLLPFPPLPRGISQHHSGHSGALGARQTNLIRLPEPAAAQRVQYILTPTNRFSKQGYYKEYDEDSTLWKKVN